MYKYWFLFILLLSPLILSVTACAPHVISEAEDVADKMINDGTLHSANIDGLHYIKFDNPKSDMSIVFIHGTPGDWKIFAYQLNDPSLQKQAQLFAVDRPSWGASTQLFNNDLTSFNAQAKGISLLLKSIRKNKPNGKIIIIGHSYGGSLVPQIALDYPSLVDLGVILAGNLTTKHTITRWYNHIANWQLTKKVLPEIMNNSNIEMLALAENIDQFNERWPNLSKPIIVIQGKKDMLVEYEHAVFAKTLITGSTVNVKMENEWGHLFLLENSKKLNSFLTQAIQ